MSNVFIMAPFIAALKLFAKPVAKSNRNLITNALQFSVFPGAVSADARNKVSKIFINGMKNIYSVQLCFTQK